MTKITEEQLRNILRCTFASTEQLAISMLLDVLNGEITIEKLKEEIEHGLQTNSLGTDSPDQISQ